MLSLYYSFLCTAIIRCVWHLTGFRSKLSYSLLFNRFFYLWNLSHVYTYICSKSISGHIIKWKMQSIKEIHAIILVLFQNQFMRFCEENNYILKFVINLQYISYCVCDTYSQCVYFNLELVCILWAAWVWLIVFFSKCYQQYLVCHVYLDIILCEI